MLTSTFYTIKNNHGINKNTLVVKIEGKYGAGDGTEITKHIRVALAHRRDDTDGIIIDLTHFVYEWGDSLLGCLLEYGDTDNEYSQAIIVSGKNKVGLASLFHIDINDAQNGIFFDSLDEAATFIDHENYIYTSGNYDEIIEIIPGLYRLNIRNSYYPNYEQLLCANYSAIFVHHVIPEHDNDCTYCGFYDFKFSKTEVRLLTYDIVVQRDFLVTMHDKFLPKDDLLIFQSTVKEPLQPFSFKGISNVSRYRFLLKNGMYTEYNRLKDSWNYYIVSKDRDMLENILQKL